MTALSKREVLCAISEMLSSVLGDVDIVIDRDAYRSLADIGASSLKQVYLLNEINDHYGIIIGEEDEDMVALESLDKLAERIVAKVEQSRA